MTDKMQKARAGLIFDSPFFASIALRLRMLEDKTCKTAYTDGTVLGYNPEFVESLPLNQVKGLVAHEVGHVMLAHHLRRQERDPQNWNIAADYALNDVLLQAGFELPDGCLKGMGLDKSAEEIYGTLPQAPQGQGGQGKQGQGQSQQGQGQGQGQPEQGQGDPGGCGEVRDAKNGQGQALSPAEVAAAEAEVKVMVAQAAQTAKSMGTLPAGLARLVGEIVEPKISWRDVLRRFIETSAKNDYSWTPPNRRYIHAGIYLPSLRSEELPELVVAIDTSGSIGQGEVNQFAAELTSVLQEFQTTCTVIYCDSAIGKTEKFTSQDLPLTLNPVGGGGTDFKPPFKWVEDNDVTPACMIYLTDLECSSIPDEPGYPVLWVNIGRERTMPFGEVITIK